MKACAPHPVTDTPILRPAGVTECGRRIRILLESSLQPLPGLRRILPKLLHTTHMIQPRTKRDEARISRNPSGRRSSSDHLLH